MRQRKIRNSDAWVVVSGHIEGRTNAQCRQRWQLLQLLHLIRLGRAETPTVDQGPGKSGRFTSEEDRRLMELYASVRNQWKLISQLMLGRTEQQCKSRYTRVLDPTLNKGPWSPDEDRRPVEIHAIHGNKWAVMDRELPGRSGPMCALLRKGNRTRKGARQVTSTAVTGTEKPVSALTPGPQVSRRSGAEKLKEPQVNFEQAVPVRAAVLFKLHMSKLRMMGQLLRRIPTKNVGCALFGNISDMQPRALQASSIF